MSRSDRPAVLVLWTGYPVGPAACRSLRRGGFRVVGAHPAGPGGRSLACPAPRRYPPPTRHPDEFVRWVSETCRSERVAAVLPLDEDIVRLLALEAPDLGPARLVGPDASQYRSLCDKAELDRLARRLGLDSPQTIVAGPDGPAGGDDSWPPLPSIVKPITSGSAVERATAVTTAAERVETLGRFGTMGLGAMVQERIVGQRWVLHIVRAPGVFEWVAHRVTAEWPRGCGLAAEKRTGPPPPGIVDAARALLDAVDYRGPLGLSFIERDGRVYPHDANLRLGATAGASIHAGFDFPRRAVEAVLSRGGRPFDGRARAGVWMRLDLELAALGDALNRRDVRATRGTLRRILRCGLGPRGALAPSPLEPFWSAQMIARAVRRVARHRR